MQLQMMSRIYYWYLLGNKMYYYSPLSMILEGLFYLIPEARLTPLSEISKIIMINLKTLCLVVFYLKAIHLDLVRQMASLYLSDKES